MLRYLMLLHASRRVEMNESTELGTVVDQQQLKFSETLKQFPSLRPQNGIKWGK